MIPTPFHSVALIAMIPKTSSQFVRFPLYKIRKHYKMRKYLVRSCVVFPNSFLHLISLDCMIADKTHWTLKAEQSNITECEKQCQEDTIFWQWFVVSNGTCYCLEAIVTGFWHTNDCKTKIQDEEKVTVHKLWHVSCPPLSSIPEKSIILTKHDPSFKIDSTALFECILGHKADNDVTSIETHCQPNGTWSITPDTLPICKPKPCSKLDQNIIRQSNWELWHHIRILQDEYVEHSTLSLHCPKDQYFYEKYDDSIQERVGEINITCKGNG